MPSVNFHIFLLVSAYFASADFIEKTAENYGPYTLDIEQLYACRGPKQANLTSYTITLVKESNIFKSSINLTFLDQAIIENAKSSVYTVKGDQKILLWNYMINKPCQHYALTKIVETYVKAQNCVVKKGTYICALNLVEIIRGYLGTSFFYGKFIFKVFVTSKKGNIICLVFHFVFKKL